MVQVQARDKFGFSDSELLNYPTVFKPNLFEDATVIVSGAGSGLGKAIAILFARLGARVAICGRDQEKLDKTLLLLESINCHALACSMSIRKPDEVESFIQTCLDEFATIDIVVNNAGGQFAQPALDFSINGWNAVVDTNLNGTWYMCQKVAQHWVRSRHAGNIVNIVADVWRGLPGMAHSCAARAGVIHFTRTLAIEWAPHDIRINCVAPGCVETSAFDRYEEDGRKSFDQSNPMKKVGDAYDIAEAVCYLAAPSGKFITGETITVDGGQQFWGEFWPAGKPDYFEFVND